jgi:hypothetical protein
MRIVAPPLILAAFLVLPIQAQTQYPKDYFRSPLNIPLQLTGNFGELRSSHYHAGLDCRTNQVIGLPVYACADGYVARLRVGSYGYGKTIYIAHPNGFTTVYAHLNEFLGDIAAEALHTQYTNQNFEFDINLPPNQLKVKKGDIIAYSGNTGSSGGPHLHFEVRDSKTEEAINPLHFGFKVPDSRPPVFKKLKLYANHYQSLIDGRNSEKEYFLQVSGGKYIVKNNQIISAGGKIGVGVEVVDFMDNVSFKNGIYTLKAYLNDSLTFSATFDKFSFEEGKRVNVHCDYKERITGNNIFERTWRFPNDNTQIYDFSLGLGEITVKPDAVSIIRIVATDFAGNKSTLEFKVKGTQPNKAALPPVYSNAIKLYHHRADSLIHPKIKLLVPSDGLFDHIENFKWSVSDKVSPLGFHDYLIHDKFVPIKKKFEAIIPFTPTLNLSQSKYLVLYEKEKFISPRFKGDKVHFDVEKFGNYSIKIDTIPPSLQSIHIKDCKPIDGLATVKFITSDNQSGIARWLARIDGEFWLLSYEHKEKLLYGNLPLLTPGEHLFELWIKDRCENQTYIREYFKIN